MVRHYRLAQPGSVRFEFILTLVHRDTTLIQSVKSSMSCQDCVDFKVSQHLLLVLALSGNRQNCYRLLLESLQHSNNCDNIVFIQYCCLG